MSKMTETENKLETLAHEITTALTQRDLKVVFAESCTGGKMASAMTLVPGVSACFCGSAVTYREATKTQWLSIGPTDLQKHTAESEFTTKAMATGVLQTTPEADIAVAITGHFGPGVDSILDGKIFVAIGQRNPTELASHAFKLESLDRKHRQTEAACLALNQLLNAIKNAF